MPAPMIPGGIPRQRRLRRRWSPKRVPGLTLWLNPGRQYGRQYVRFEPGQPVPYLENYAQPWVRRKWTRLRAHLHR